MTRRDDGIPTPKQSGSLQRAPVFAALALGVQKVMLEKRDELLGEEACLLGRGPRGYADLDIARAKEVGVEIREVRAFAARAEELSNFFASWEAQDPGPEARLAGVMRLRDLEAETKKYMPAF